MIRYLVLFGILFFVLNLGGQAEEFVDGAKGERHNITEGAIFINDFRDQTGVQELKSGILYKVRVSGVGKTPKLSDRVKVSYVGKQVNGRVFDQSKVGEPREFRLDRTVPGWQDVLPRMREGDSWEVVIPSHLAYGATGSPYANIGPNETLFFLIELVEVIDPSKKSD